MLATLDTVVISAALSAFTYFPEASPTDESGIELLLRQCDRAAVVQIKSVKQVQQAPPIVERRFWRSELIHIAELELRRTIVGPKASDRLFILVENDAEGEWAPEAGATLAVLLTRNSALRAWASSETKARVEEMCGGTWPLSPLEGGIWVITGSGEARELSKSIALPPAVKSAPDPIAAVGDWLEKEADKALPIIAAKLVSSGPSQWQLILSRNGWVMEGRKTYELEPAEWDRVLSVMRRQRFWELPASVGYSEGPESSSRVIELRTRHGSTSVQRYDSGERSAPAVGADEIARFGSIWRALPGRRKPDGAEGSFSPGSSRSSSSPRPTSDTAADRTPLADERG